MHIIYIYIFIYIIYNIYIYIFLQTWARWGPDFEIRIHDFSRLFIFKSRRTLGLFFSFSLLVFQGLISLPPFALSATVSWKHVRGKIGFTWCSYFEASLSTPVLWRWGLLAVDIQKFGNSKILIDELLTLRMRYLRVEMGSVTATDIFAIMNAPDLIRKFGNSEIEEDEGAPEQREIVAFFRWFSRGV